MTADAVRVAGVARGGHVIGVALSTGTNVGTTSSVRLVASRAGVVSRDTRPAQDDLRRCRYVRSGRGGIRRPQSVRFDVTHRACSARRLLAGVRRVALTTDLPRT